MNMVLPYSEGAVDATYATEHYLPLVANPYSEGMLALLCTEKSLAEAADWFARAAENIRSATLRIDFLLNKLGYHLVFHWLPFQHCFHSL